MATTPLRGIKCPDRVLIPTNEAQLLSAVSDIATSAAFVKCDNKRVGGNGGDPWEADPRSRIWPAG